MKTLRSTRFSTTAVLAGAAALAPLGASAASLTEALDVAPADAEVVLAFPSLQGFSSMVARLAETVGMEDEGTDDLLGSFKREFGVSAGLDDAGAGLVVLTNVSEALENSTEPDVFMVLPVTDYDAFVASLEKPAEAAAAAEGAAPGVTAVLLDGSESVVRQVGSYAVLSEEGADVAAYEAANAAAAAMEAMGGYTADAGSPDAAVWVKVAPMRAGLEKLVDGMVAQAGEGGASDPGSMLGRAFAPLYAEAVRGMAASVDSFLVTARMTPDHVSLDYAGRVKAGSPMAAYLTDERTDPLALLAGLPDDPFLTAQTTDLSALDLQKLTAALVASAGRGADNLGDDPNGEAMAGAIKSLIEAWAAIAQPAEGATAYAQVNYASDPQAMMAGGVFQTLTAMSAADPAAVQRAFPAQLDAMKEDLVPAFKELMASMNPGDQPAPEVAVNGSYTAGALTLANTPVDRYEISFVLPPEMLEGMGPAGFMLGNAGMSGFATASDGIFLQTTSAEPAFMERALLATKKDAAVPTLADAPALAGVADALPEGLISAGYFSMQGVAETANPFMMMFLPEAEPLAVPADLAPVSLGLGMKPAGGDAAGGHDLGLRANIPVRFLEFVRDTYQQMAPAAGMGGEPRGPGGGAPPAPF